MFPAGGFFFEILAGVDSVLHKLNSYSLASLFQAKLEYSNSFLISIPHKIFLIIVQS
jgi:hypothetical protein